MVGDKERLYKYIIENSFNAPPSVRELCEALNIKSTSTVHALLHELEDEGMLVIEKGKRRNISVAGDIQTVKVPILGVVAAGVPILAQENIEGFITVERPRSGGSDLFALRVKGDSMINAGILEGDVIVARKAETADDGEIVVALIGDEATVKRLYRRDGRVELHAENPAYSPIISNELVLLGKVVALNRYYE